MLNQQIPDGPADLICPFHRGRMSKHCKTCPLWIKVRGMNPNTGAEIDQWHCSFTWLPMLLIETAKEVRQGAAATESFRNEMVHRADNAAAGQQLARIRAANGAQHPLMIDAQ